MSFLKSDNPSTSSNRSFGVENDELVDVNLTLDADKFEPANGNSTESDLSDFARQYNNQESRIETEIEKHCAELKFDNKNEEDGILFDETFVNKESVSELPEKIAKPRGESSVADPSRIEPTGKRLRL